METGNARNAPSLQDDPRFKNSIAGVEVKALTMLFDNRGFLMEILRGSDPIKQDGSASFGQYYLMAVYPAVIKGKHFHKLQYDHMCCIRGRAALHLQDARPESPTRGMRQVIVFGEGDWKLVKIPPGVWHSAENTGSEVALIVNYVTREYDRGQPDEYRDHFDKSEKLMPWEPSAVG